MYDIYRKLFMSEDKNYEAIGRYHSCQENLTKLIDMRCSLAKRIGEGIRPLEHESLHVGRVKKVSIDALNESMKEMAKIISEIEIAINELNMYAESAGYSKIDRY